MDRLGGLKDSLPATRGGSGIGVGPCVAVGGDVAVGGTSISGTTVSGGGADVVAGGGWQVSRPASNAKITKTSVLTVVFVCPRAVMPERAKYVPLFGLLLVG